MTQQRFLLKLSGEALGGSLGKGIEPEVISRICQEVAELNKQGYQLGIVLGGGNLFRGSQLVEIGLDRITGDRMGMLATIMNGLAFKDILARYDVKSWLMSALDIPGFADVYEYRKAIELMNQGYVVVCSGGTGNPFFTTDTAACLRGVELEVDMLLKATKVDYIYDKDPKKHSDARPYKEISIEEALQQKLEVMDLTAMCLLRDHKKKMRVFDLTTQGNLAKAVAGEVGTLLYS